MFSKNLFVGKVAGKAGAKGQNSNILTQCLRCLTWDQAEIKKIDFILQKKKFKKNSNSLEYKHYRLKEQDSYKKQIIFRRF